MKTEITVLLFCAWMARAAELTDNANIVTPPKVGVLKFENVSRVRQPTSVDNPAFWETAIPWFNQDIRGRPAFGPASIKVDRYSEVARTLLEVQLSSWEDIELLERNRVEALQQELRLNKARGGTRAVDENPLRQYGAHFLVLGQILDLWTESSVTSAYGMTFDTQDTKAQISIRVVEVSSEKPVFIGEVTGSHQIANESGAITGHSDAYAAAIKNAVRNLCTNPKFRTAVLHGIVSRSSTSFAQAALTDTVNVMFAPKDGAADVIIDGIYVGTTPLERRLTRGATVKIQLSSLGETLWQHPVVVESGLSIAPELFHTNTKTNLNAQHP